MKKILSIGIIAAMIASCNDSKKDDAMVTPADSTNITMDANDAARIADSAAAAHQMDTSHKMMTNRVDTLKGMNNVVDSAHNKQLHHDHDKMKESDKKKP